MKIIFDEQEYKEIWDKLMARTEKQPGEEGCWKWTGAQSFGYGQMSYKHLHYTTHVWSFLATHHRFPKEGLEILHECDNRSCLRPDHLSEGTHKRNMYQTKENGNPFFADHRGEKSPTSKLTWEQVRKIRHYRGIIPARVLAKMYGISAGHIGHLWKGQGWKEEVNPLDGTPYDELICTSCYHWLPRRAVYEIPTRGKRGHPLYVALCMECIENC